MPGDDDIPAPSVEPEAQPASGLPMAATPEAMGAGIGNSLEQAGMISARVGFDAAQRQAAIQMHADQARLSQAVGAMGDDNLTTFHGPKGVFASQAGASAPQVFNDALAAQDAKMSALSAKLPPSVQPAFTANWQHERQGILEHGLDWQTKEVQGADKQAFETNQTMRSNEALASAQGADPAKVSQGVNAAWSKLAAQTIDYGTRNNWTKDQIQASITKNTSESGAQIVQSYVDSGDLDGAKAFMAVHGPDIQGEPLVRVQKMMAVSNIDAQSAKLAGSIVTGDRAPNNSEDALAQLASQPGIDPQVRQKAEGEIVNHYKQMDAAHNDHQQRLTQAATDAVDQAPGHVIPPSVMVGLDYKNREAVLAYKDKVIKDGEPKTDPTTYAEIQSAFADPQSWKANFGDGTKPGSFNLNQYRANLSDADYKTFSKQIADTQQKVVKQDQTLGQGAVATSVTKDLFEANGLVPKAGTSKGDPDYDRVMAQQGQFLQQLHRTIAADQLKNERPSTPDEVTARAQELFATQTWQDWRSPTHHWLGSDTFPAQEGPAFTRPGMDKKAYAARDIPSDEMARIQDAASKHGVSLTDQQMIDIYNDHVLNPPIQAPTPTRGR